LQRGEGFFVGSRPTNIWVNIMPWFQEWDIRAGTLDLQIANTMAGELLSQHPGAAQRGGAALVGVLQEAYMLGVSTYTVELVEDQDQAGP
jgi:hypothetical protein